MKNLLQLIVAIILLSITTLYANATTYNKNESADNKSVIDDFSVSKLVEEEIKAIEQDKIEEETATKRERAIKISRGISRSVPKGNTSMKSYMNYKTITNKSSEQYKLQNRDDVWTDEEGFRRIEDKFMVAVGTFYSKEVGQELIIELDNGTTFDAIVGDIKDDKHTDSTNRQHKVDKSVIEFVVDTKKLDSTIRKTGNCSYSTLNQFQGNISNIIVLPKDE